MIRKFKNVVKINKKETEDGQIFYYFDIEPGIGMRTVRVWISKEMVNIIEDRYGELCVEFPVKNCEIVKGKKPNTLILKKGTKTVFFIDTDQKEGSLQIKKISPEVDIIVQRVVIDDIKTILATTNQDEIVFEWEYIYRKRNHRHEIVGIFKINNNKEKLLLENISADLLTDIINSL